MRGCSDLTAWWHFSNSATSQVKLLQPSMQDKTHVAARDITDVDIQAITADVQKKLITPDCSSRHLENKCIHLSVNGRIEHCIQVCSSHALAVMHCATRQQQACSTTSICLMSMMMIKVLLEFMDFSIAIKQTHLKSRYGGRHSNLFKLGSQRKASKSCQPHESALLCLHSPPRGQPTSQL